jgi:Tfp pilus assembly protein PilZ
MEKRELVRVAFDIEAIIKYEGRTFSGKVDNLSLKGMFIQTSEKFKLYDTIQITIHLAGETSDLEINLNGLIVRTTEQGIGIQFEKVDLDSFIHLRNIVAYNSGDEDKVMDEFCTFINHKTASNK